MDRITHGLAINLTEHFQVTGTYRGVPRRHWDRFPSRLALAVDRALALLKKHEIKATFLVDPWIAERHAELLETIRKQGHPIAPQGSSLEQKKNEFINGTLLRLLPESLVEFYLMNWRRATKRKIFAFDIWQLDPTVPRLANHTKISGLRMYRNLDQFATRLDRLFSGALFGPVPANTILKTNPDLVTRPSRNPSDETVGKAPTGAPISVVVPCFNEEPNLAYLDRTLAQLSMDFGSRHPLQFVLVDDGSTDGTWREMQRLFSHDQNFKLVQHPANRGIGAAIRTGIMSAEDDIVAVIDSDCSYDPTRIEDMLPLLENDVAIVTASPYHRNGGVQGVPAWRLFLSRGASLLYRNVLHNKLATYTSCFRIYRKSAILGVEQRHEGYIGVVEMLARLDMMGWKIVEHPVVLEARLLGQSKMKVINAITNHLRFIGEIFLTRLVSKA